MPVRYAKPTGTLPEDNQRIQRFAGVAWVIRNVMRSLRADEILHGNIRLHAGYKKVAIL